MGKTTNLGLHTTATNETSKTFLEYRTELSGTGADSNMNIIDKAYGDMDDKIDAVNDTLDAKIDANKQAETNKFSTLDGTVSGIQSSLSQEVTARTSGDQLLQSQINQIVAPSGTIDGASAAEVENARVGVDATTYASLGEAIRGQVGNLKSDIIPELKNAINAMLCPIAFSPIFIASSWINSYGKASNVSGTASNKYTRTGLFDRNNSERAIGLDNPIYEYRVSYYDETGALDGTGFIGQSTWHSGIQHFPPEVKKFAITIRAAGYSSDAERPQLSMGETGADEIAIKAALREYTSTDTDLKASGAAADAKLVGELIAPLNMNEYNEIDVGDYLPNAIKYEDGELSPSTAYGHTDYIDIGLYNRIQYSRLWTGLSSTSLGMAYYDETKNYIIGVSALTDNPLGHASYETAFSYPPPGAKYIRFTVLLDVYTFGSFRLSVTSRMYRRMHEINDEIKSLVDNLYPFGKEFSGTLRQNWVSYSNGSIGRVSPSLYCSCDFYNYKTDTVIELGLTDYKWHAWSYSGEDGRYATHSNTNKELVDGSVPIFVKKEIADSYFVFEVRRKDGAVLTTDLSDPTSDYSIIGNALRIHTMPDKNSGGYIFRMENNPDPIPVGDNALEYTDFLTQTWDTFLTDYPSEITKTVIGVSSTTETVTTEYNIYKYVFAPRDWSRTVFLSAGCHGNEYEGFWGLYRIMRMIWDEGYKYQNLRELRHNTRFVIVPIWNPWGVVNRVRECPLGFPANENINAPATVGSTTYPAFTSKECQAIKSIFDEYEGELSLWVDLHTDPFSSLHPTYKKGCYGYAPINSAINRVLYGFTVDFHNIIKAETGYSTNVTIYDGNTTSNAHVIGYGNYRGIPTALLETSINEYAETGTGLLMKYAQEWYGNVIAAMLNVC